MTPNHSGRTPGSHRPIVTRRRFLAGVGTGVAAGLAGCSGITQQSFEASAVVLPEAEREELVLAETARDSATIERDGPAGIQVSITNHASVYQRGLARGTPTALEAFTGMVNGTPGSGSTINAVGNEIGIDRATLGVFEGTPTVDGDNVSVVLPAGARTADGSVMHGKLMALILGEAMELGSLVYDGEGRGVLLPGDAYFPVNTSLPERGVVPPGDMWLTRPDNPSAYRVLVPNAEAFSGWFGTEALPDGAEWVEPGGSVETAQTVFSSTVADFENPHDLPPASEVYDAGVPLPLGGSPFGLGVLATPSASVGGLTLNPLVGLETGELLRNDVATRLVAGAGLGEADTLDWAAGPEFVAGREGMCLGIETEIETHVGVVRVGPGPWGVSVQVARVSPDDHVVAAAVRWRPVGTVDGGMGTFDSVWWNPTEPSDGLVSTNALADDAIGSLEQR